MLKTTWRFFLVMAFALNTPYTFAKQTGSSLNQTTTWEAFFESAKKNLRSEQVTFLQGKTAKLNGKSPISMEQISANTIRVLIGEQSATVKLVNAKTREVKFNGKSVMFSSAAKIQDIWRQIEGIVGQNNHALLDLLLPRANAEAFIWILMAATLLISGVMLMASTCDGVDKASCEKADSAILQILEGQVTPTPEETEKLRKITTRMNTEMTSDNWVTCGLRSEMSECVKTLVNHMNQLDQKLKANGQPPAPPQIDR